MLSASTMVLVKTLWKGFCVCVHQNLMVLYVAGQVRFSQPSHLSHPHSPHSLCAVVAVVPPQIVQSPRDVEVEILESVEFFCDAMASPQPSYSWFKVDDTS